MENRIKNLSIVTVLLLGLSVFTYIQDHKRGSALVSGSDFIAGFDVSKVAKLVIKEGSGESVSLLKDGENFVLENHYSYPASNEKINDLLYKIANIQITQTVTEKKSAHKKFELTEDKSKIRVSGYDRTGIKTFDFLVGKKKRFNGNFIRFASKDPVYLSNKALFFSGEKDSYIESEILNMDEKDFLEISLKSEGKELIFTKKGEGIVFKNEASPEVSLSTEKKKKILAFLSDTQPVSFNDFKPINFKELKSLKFDLNLEIKSTNKMVYNLSYSKLKDDYYLKVSSRLENLPKQIVINENDDKAKLAGVEDILKAQKAVTQFNLSNSRWIFKIDKSVYEDIKKFAKDFKS
jgi:hypothetical protein